MPDAMICFTTGMRAKCICPRTKHRQSSFVYQECMLMSYIIRGEKKIHAVVDFSTGMTV